LYHPEISKLIVKHLNASLSPREKQQLDEWRASSEDNEKLFARLTDLTYLSQKLKMMQEIGKGSEWADMRQERRTGILRALPQTALQKALVAAVAIGIIIVGIRFIFPPTKTPQLALTTVKSAAKTIHEVIPGSNKASLILADGRSIELDQAKSGVLTEQEGIAVSKQDQGIIAYAAADASASPAVFNTLSTPKGSQYKIILPDGSQAWLNAQSSIKYPVRFNQEGREVEITGEVYFEVKPQYSLKDHQKIPFRVITPKQEIQVLGTHFDVNAYGDEGITSTTLLEGSVRVTHGNLRALLKPGQQSRLGKSGSIKVVKVVDTMDAVAWKKGEFKFNECTMKEIMYELARWYDTEVIYKSYKSTIPFTTTLSRNDSLLTILDKLKATNEVTFKIDGRKIIVMM
jgi:transmembrane sensor